MSKHHPPLRSTVAALGGLIALVVGAPAALLAAAQHRLGHLSPLHGMSAPWTWTVREAKDWFAALGRGFETSDDLIDWLFRIGISLGWICLTVLVVTVVGEVVFQLRHGMPSTPRRSGPGLGRLARFIASGLVAVLPFGASSAMAAPGDGLVRSAAVTHVTAVTVAHGGELAGTATDAARGSADAAESAVSWSSYRVAAGDSVWSIAERIAAGRDVDVIAQQIVEANLGRTMNDGAIFATAALIEPGWSLTIPGPGRLGREAAVALPARSDTHTVVSGDSYWGIAEDRLAEIGEELPAARDTHAATVELMALNAPRLGHRDPRLLLPGEVVALSPALIEPVVVQVAPAEPARIVPVVEPAITDALPPAAPAVESAVIDGAATVVDVDHRSAPAAPIEVDTSAASAPLRSSRTAASPSRSALGAEMGIAGAVLLASGALALLESRRRRLLRAAQVGQRLAPSGALERRAESQLRSMTDGDVVARLDIAMRAAARDVAAAGARVLFVMAERNGELVVVLDRECQPVDSDVWQPAGADRWRLTASTATVELAERARRNAQPCPAMVHLGRCADGLLFVDIEAIGLLSLDTSDEAAEAITRHIGASLAVSPFGDTLRLISVGLEPAVGLGADAAEQLHSLDAALDAAAVSLGSTPAMSRTNGSTFALRAAASSESWGPAIVLASGVAADEALAADLVGLCGAGGRGLGVVVDVPLDGAVWTLRERDGVFTMLPAGIDVVPVGISRRDLGALDSLLASADQALLPAPHPALALVGGSHHVADHDGDVEVDPAWALMVRLLGPVEVEGRDGGVVAFERSKALELVVWLSQHRQRATRTAARTALWDLDVRDATFANVVSDARRALARAVTPPEGEEWIGRTLTESLPLHDAVVTDADLLTRRLEASRRLDSAAARDVLRPGLEFVTGLPFADTAYLWPDAEGISSSLILLVVAAATEFANHALVAGDIDDVFWATGQGLQALPGHEELIAIRMRAHAALGDLSGVRSEWESYERVLHAETWDSGEPSPKLVALRRQLLLPSLAS
jgi:LysM repeat protein